MYDQSKRSESGSGAKGNDNRTGGWKVQLKQDMRGLSYEEGAKATSAVQLKNEHGAAAPAADPGSKEEQVKAALTRWLDVNGDGQITMDEVKQRFAQVDHDKDGKLNKDEVVSALVAAGIDNWWKGIAAGKIIDKYDRDGDGKLSMEELKAAAGA